MLRRNVSLGHSPHRLPGGSEQRMDAFLWMRHVINMYSSYTPDRGWMLVDDDQVCHPAIRSSVKLRGVCPISGTD